MVKKWLHLHSDPSSIVLTKWKKAPNGSWVMLTCETEEMATKLIQYFVENTILNEKGKQLTATKAETTDNKRKRENDDDDRPSKTKPTGVLTDDQVRDKLIPLWRSPYQDQLGQKLKTMIKMPLATSL